MGNVKIKNCGEPIILLDSSEFVLEPMYFKMNFTDNDEIKLRHGVVQKLRESKKNLREISGCEKWNFKIWDGFRTIDTQKILYKNYWDELKKNYPHLTDAQLDSAVQIFVAPPSRDLKFPAPHNTGGAVDLTLIDETGKNIDMGTGFDEFNARSFTAHFKAGHDDLCDPSGLGITINIASLNPHSSSECRVFHKNRMLLKQILEEVGFTNYWSEWWHFSFGDQNWARIKNVKYAIYGSAELDA